MKTKSRAKPSLALRSSEGRSPSEVTSTRRGLPAIKPQKLLVPVDFSPDSGWALDYAASLAGQFGSAITVLHVVEPIKYVCDFGYGPVARERSNQAVIKSARAHLRRLARRHLGNQPPSNVVVRSGTAFREITTAAKELGTDLIVMPTRGLTDSEEVLLGSTAERVVRHAPCPVLTLRKTKIVRTRRS
jgi:nucleotide-binding universal stress UspA family protein